MKIINERVQFKDSLHLELYELAEEIQPLLEQFIVLHKNEMGRTDIDQLKGTTKSLESLKKQVINYGEKQ